MAPKTKAPVKTKKRAEKPKAAPKTSNKESGLVKSVVSAEGATAGKITLEKALFDEKINTQLLSQAMRVYLANQREGSASTKTRGKVEGSTRKIYRQKGTGRARHGSIRAPIFVGGGIVFGPVPRDYSLKMTKSMKRIALTSALTAKRDDVMLVDGLEDAKKTKEVARTLKAAGVTGSVLLVVPKESRGLVRVARNIANLTIISATDLNPYSVMSHNTILFTKNAIKESTAHFTKHV